MPNLKYFRNNSKHEQHGRNLVGARGRYARRCFFKAGFTTRFLYCFVSNSQFCIERMMGDLKLPKITFSCSQLSSSLKNLSLSNQISSKNSPWCFFLVFLGKWKLFFFLVFNSKCFYMHVWYKIPCSL